MTNTEHDDLLTALPTERDVRCPFDPPAAQRTGRPLRRMVYPDGHVGWLATGYAVVRAVLSNPRFSSRHELIHNPISGMAGPGGNDAAPTGDMTGIDPPEHTRFRQLLVGKFTARRMRLLTKRVEQITRDQLDVLAAHSGPVDLWTLFAQPVPALVLCELLGVPFEDYDTFQRHTQMALTQDGRPEEVGMAFQALYRYMRELVLAKRTKSTDDLLSDLTETDLTDGELAGLSVLLVAGLDTTASMLGLGTFALLRNPEQLAALSADPSRWDAAVEELLRYLSVAPRAVRSALEDVELDGRLIKAGESVTVSIEAANRDDERFADPDALDVLRQAGGHLAFGHGIHQCLGQQLARVELGVAFPALFARFPNLRLAVPADEVPLRANMSVFGVRELPVVWDEG